MRALTMQLELKTATGAAVHLGCDRSFAEVE
jgi:hypothetical protein